MFPHLLHTKQFLDWRFGRQDTEDNESTAAGDGGTDRGTAGTGGGVWPMTRRRPRRLRVDSRRPRLSKSNLLSRRRPAVPSTSRHRSRSRSHSSAGHRSI